MLKRRPDPADAEEVASCPGPAVAGAAAGARPCEERGRVATTRMERT